VLQLTKAPRFIRTWFAVVAAYALALQLLATGAVAAQAMAHADLFAGTLLAICHGDGESPADQDGTGRPPPLPQAHCILCTLTGAAVAILPTADALSVIHAEASDVVPRHHVRILAYDSPTHQYQRGPPAAVHISG